MTKPQRVSIPDVGRGVAALGVILSLVFVGLQLRQATVVARAQARQGLADRGSEVINSVTENPELARAWLRRWGVDRPSDELLSPTDSVQANWAMFGMLRHVENVYLQYLEGVVDESVLDSYGFRHNEWFETPSFAAFWSTQRDRFDPRFVAAFDREYGF